MPAIQTKNSLAEKILEMANDAEIQFLIINKLGINFNNYYRERRESILKLYGKPAERDFFLAVSS